MNNLFSIIKNKKIFLAFLILTICLEFLCLNHNVNAQEFPDWYNTNTNTESIALDARDDAEKCTDNLSWYKAIIAGFSDILLYAPKQIAYYGTNISSWVISMVLNWPITKATGESGSGAALAFIAGWQSVKDIANMLIVLGFVIIGIAFTLRLEGYGSKKALINLIIIALLINFSGLFCGLFIDAANITMNSLTSGTSGTMGIAFYKNIESKENTSKCSALEDNDLGKYIMDNVLFGVIYALVAFCFIYLAVILIARYAYLGILFMLSPLAFACWAIPIPKLKDIWNKWWSEFLKWVFIGVSICFFLNIAGNVINAFPALNESTTTLNTLVFYLLIDIIIIVVGIKISTKSSGVGALVSSAIMGTAMAAVTGGASVAAGGGLAALNKFTGGRASSYAEGAKAMGGRALERIGLRQTGTADSASQKRVEEKGKSLSTAFAAAKARGDTATMNRIRNNAKTKRGAEGAAAMQAIIENKDINETFKDASGKFDASAASARITYAESVGGKDIRKKATLSTPILEAHNQQVVEKIKKAHPGWSERKAQYEAVVRAAAKVSEEDLNRDFVDSVGPNVLRDAGSRMTNKKREALARNSIDSLQNEVDALNASVATLSPEELRKLTELSDKLRELRALTPNRP